MIQNQLEQISMNTQFLVQVEVSNFDDPEYIWRGFSCRYIKRNEDRVVVLDEHNEEIDITDLNLDELAYLLDEMESKLYTIIN
jgi:ATP:corrinoid adenosyltransferase